MRIALALAAVTLLPGLPLAGLTVRRLRDGIGWLAVASALGLLWSVGTTLALTLARLPLTPANVVLANALPALFLLVDQARRRRFGETLRSLSASPLNLAIVSLTCAAVAVPLLTVQRGLPTGDVQKSIFWAERILETQTLPHYQEALRLNRDPADFAIPGLHTLTAAVIALGGEAFFSTAWFSLVSAFVLAGLAIAFADLLAPRLPAAVPLAFVFAATNPRFLRYTVAPGYHYQNLFGELFLLLGLFFLLLTLGGRGKVRLILGSVFATAALPFVHQFTAFLAFFLFPILLGVLVWKYRGEVHSLFRWMSPAKGRRLLAAAALVTAVALGALLGPFRQKVPHLFTTTPHLLPYVLSPSSIPVILGIPFALLGLTGVLVTLVRLRRRELDGRWFLVLLWMLLLLALSQGPRWFIDIPSARTLFYLTTPLALVAAVGLASALERVAHAWPRAAPLLIPAGLALVLAPSAGASLNLRLQTVDHALQANATLTPSTLELLKFLDRNPPSCSHDSQESTCADGILIDDWNGRRLTWTVLSPYRMLTRVGADLAVIAREAQQSRQRRTQYETLLDFEKVFTLGNQPEILPLLRRHGIGLIATANDLSTDALEHNPGLEVVYGTGESTVFRVRDQEARGNGEAFAELLAERTTLANDIGDSEDVFARLPVSLLAPQISEIIVDTGRTLRDVQSARSSIGINTGSYVPELWDANHDRLVDAPVALALRVVANGARGRLTRGTTVFTNFDLPTDGSLRTIRATIPAGQLPIDEQGLSFVTLRLDHAPLRIDLIAAGLAFPHE